MRAVTGSIHRVLTTVCAVAMATSLMGCASSSGSTGSVGYTADTEMATEEYVDYAVENDEGETTEKRSDSDEGKVIIKDATVVLRTRGYDEALDAVRKIIAEGNGTQVSSSESGGYSRSITIEARVDPDKIEETVEKLRTIEGCTVLSANLSSNDVTRTFNETERRIEILEEQYEHYKQMLEQATTTEDMLLISDRMYDVLAEIKVLTDERDDMAHNAARSLLRVTIEEELATGSSSTQKGNIYADAWEDSWGFFGEALQALALLAIFLIPFALLVLVIVGIIILIRRRRKKKRAEKEAEAGATETTTVETTANAPDAPSTPTVPGDSDDGRPQMPPLQ